MRSHLLIIGVSLSVIALAHLSLAFLSFLQMKPRDHARRCIGILTLICSGFCGCIGLSYIAAYLGRDYELTYRCAWIGYLGFPFYYEINLLHQDHIKKWQIWVKRSALAFWSLILFLVITTDLIDRAPSSFIPFIKQSPEFETPVRLLAAALLILLILDTVRVRNNAVAVKRHKSNFYLLGLFFYLAGGFLFAGGLQNITGISIDPGLAGFFSLPWMVLTYYAVSRHRLFNIPLAISKLLSLVVVSSVIAGLSAIFYSYFLGFTLSTLALVVSVFLGSAFAIGLQLFSVTLTFFQVVLLRDRIDFQEVLKRISELTVSLINVDEILRRFVKLIYENFHISSTHFFVAVEGKFKPQASRSNETLARINISDFDSTALVKWFTKNKKAFVKEEELLSSDSEEIMIISKSFEFLGAEVAIPAFYQEKLVGFLLLGPKLNGNAFLNEDLQLFDTVLAQIALSLENARLFEEATTDGLTGLYHHKYFKSRLKNEYQRAVRSQRTMGVLMVDIDFFKKINDQYGHLIGDEVLKEVSKMLLQGFRAEDVVARYGGEEFVVLLIEPKIDQVNEIANRLRQKVSEHIFTKGIRASISIGAHVSDLRLSSQSELDFLAKADEALYQAKNSGRNRVVIWNSSISETDSQRIVGSIKDYTSKLA